MRQCAVCGITLGVEDTAEGYWRITGHEFKCYQQHPEQVPEQHEVAFKNALAHQRRSIAAYKGVETRRRKARQGKRTKAMTFHEACAVVYQHCPNVYAKGYAEAGLAMEGAYEQQIQALYILSNIGHWRGEETKVVRAALKEIAKDV